MTDYRPLTFRWVALGPTVGTLTLFLFPKEASP